MSYLSNVWLALTGKTQPPMGAKADITATSRIGWDPVQSGGWASASNIYGARGPRELAGLAQKSALVFACVRETSTSLGQAPLQIGVVNPDGEFESIGGHERLGLFYENPWYSYSQMIELIVSRLSLTGMSALWLTPWKNRPGVGQLVPLPTSQVKMIASGVELLGYELIGAAKPIRIPAEEMCVHKYVDPASFHGYLSPMAAAQREYDIDKERQDITIEILKNKKLPGLILEAERSLNAQQREMLKKSMEAAGGAAANRGKSIVLPNGVKVSPGMPPTDMDFSRLSFISESRICMAFQVPPILVGSAAGLEKSSYANYDSARKSFYTETLEPFWSFIADVLNRSLILPGENLEFRFDLSKITELQESKNEAVVRAGTAYEKGIARLSEARAMIGLPPLEDGEEDGFKGGASEPVEIDTEEDPAASPFDEEGED